MKQEWLVFNYTTTQFQPQKDTCNESKTENILDLQFHGQEYRKAVVWIGYNKLDSFFKVI